MATNTAETFDLTVKELPDFAGSLNLVLQIPEHAKLREPVETALSAECVQCGLRLNGADLLRFGAGQGNDDPRFERLRVGYCGRNGCDCLFYRVIGAAHPEIDWPKLIHPAHTISEEEKGAARREAAKAAAKIRWKMRALRIGAAVVALLIVLIVRQFWVGGSIPFVRQPENFKVDRVIDTKF